MYSTGLVFKGGPHFLKLNIKCLQDVLDISANIFPRVGIVNDGCFRTSAVRNSGKGE